MKFALTWLVSVLWSTLNGARRRVYDLGLLKRVVLPLPTVSVGNIEVGGTGKTPVVIALAREAIALGKTPLILTRGYRGIWEKTGGVLVPRSTAVDPRLCGDEAALIQMLVPEAWIAVGADRARGFAAAIQVASQNPQHSCADVVILDDGHQHLKIARDWELVLLTSARPGERLFREWSSSLVNGGAERRTLVWTKGLVAPEHWSGVRALLSVESADLECRSDRLWLVSGVARPQDFEQSVRLAGWNVVRRTDFGDHSPYTAEWIAEAVKQAGREGLRLAITGKDWVKWSRLGAKREDVRVFEPSVTFEPALPIGQIFSKSGVVS